MNPYLKNHHFWEEAPFFRLLLALVIGIACYDFFHPELQAHIRWFGISTISVLLLFFTFLKTRNELQSTLKAVSTLAIFIIIGYGAAAIHDHRNYPNWYGTQVGSNDAMVVRVERPPQEKARTIKLWVTVTQILSGNHSQKAIGNALVYVYKTDSTPVFVMGDELLISAQWQPIVNSGNPNAFDYARFCSRNNVYHQQFLSASEIIRFRHGQKSKLPFSERVHTWAMQQLFLHVKDTGTLGLLQAMLLGDEVNFKEEDRQLYVDTGIIHVVAISGGHIAFLMFLITSTLFWIKKKKYQWMKLAIALPLVIFYVMVAGAPPSAVRAAMIFTLLAMGSILGREHTTLNTLLAAAFFILLVVPMWLFSVGFQLSFVAVLSLILFYRKIESLYPTRIFAVRFIWKTIAASIAAELLIAPLVIYYFHLLPAMFLLANVIAVMLMGTVMSLGLAIILLSSWLPMCASLLAVVVTYIVKGFHVVIAMLRSFNPESLAYLHLSLPELILCYGCIASLAIMVMKQSKPALFVAMASLCILLLLLNMKSWRTLQSPQWVVYNIPRYTYAEYHSGGHYTILSERGAPITAQQKAYAIRENHTVLRSWKQLPQKDTADCYTINHQTVLFLHAPLRTDSIPFTPIDYLIVTYPLKKFEAQQWRRVFDFKQVIITGNQKRKLLQQWKDSCGYYGMRAHFTLLDGAFVAR